MILSREFSLKNDLRLIIRNAEENDAERIIEYIQKVSTESNNLSFGEGEFNISVDEEKKLISSVKDTSNCLFILGIIDNRIVSVLNFNGGKRARLLHVGEFGITVLKEFWGLGIGRLMLQFMINWARESKLIRKINLRARIDNYSAIELYKKIGFKEEGILIRDMMVNGEFVDSIIMGLCID